MIAIKRHFCEMADNPNVELVGCCDYVPERAAQMAQQYGCKAYPDHKAMLAGARPDAVVVCSNNATHRQMTVDAFEAGAHVLCEKPMSVSLEDAAAMIEMGKKTGKKLMIAHNQRMSAAYRKAKKILASGELGKVLTFRTVFGHPGCEFWAIDGTSSWFFDKSLAAFGCVADLGVHKVDLMRWLLDEEFDEVCAYCATLDKHTPDGAPVSVEDNMVGIMRSRSGIIGTIATSWTYYGPEDNSSIFYCRNGILRVCDDPDYQVIINCPDGTNELHMTGGVGSNDKPIKTGIDDEFINAILEDREPAISGEEGYNSLAVAIALDTSSRNRNTTKVQQYPAKQ